MKSFVSINGKTIENPIVKYSIIGFAIFIIIPALTLLIIPLIGVAVALIAAAIVLVAVVAPIVLIYGKKITDEEEKSILESIEIEKDYDSFGTGVIDIEADEIEDKD
jgi:high-affinity Fe2+/Pb2+ permease